MNKYRDYIKSQPCAVCADDSGSDIHHLIQIPGAPKGLSRKLPDLISIPLCRQHHNTLHSNVEDFELWYGKQAEILVRVLIKAEQDGQISYVR